MPTGSLFCITEDTAGSGKVLRPLALNCLAHPSGICVNSSDTAVYVYFQKKI